MRKYIHMAKEVKPQLSEEASNFIAERYAELRSADMGRVDMERVSWFYFFDNLYATNQGLPFPQLAHSLQF
jgi:hypothetical protein